MHHLIECSGDDKVWHTGLHSSDYSVNKLGLKTNTQHLNLSEIIFEGILSTDELLNYKVYGVCRNPLERFLSAANYILSGKAHTSDEAVEFLLSNLNFESNLQWLILPQSYWLRQCEGVQNKIYPYEKLHSMLEDLTGRDIPELYHHRAGNQNLTIDSISDKNRLKITELYRNDYDLHLSQMLIDST